MCGICGIINFDDRSVSERHLKTIMQRMKHRGPDDEGVFIDNHVGIGIVRLSIIDLSPRGHQPMFDLAGQYVIIHNGEVYNYIELRAELVKRGYQFQSNSDTEVILYSYMEWGEACLDKFNGMWAFVIYDKKTKKIFISRDRYGIKPLYYYLDKKRFIFASEIPAILAVLGTRPSPNHQAIFDYLVFNRTDQTDDTFFKKIKKLPHGNTITIQNNKINMNKWYDLRKSIGKPFENPDEFKETFSSAVSLRLRSDVPLGVCLSGGLDSSSIVSVLLHDFNKYDLNTFSAVYGEGKPGDESKFIGEYKNILRNMYFTYPTAETMFNDMSNFVKAHSEPIPTSAAYGQFKVMELAKEHVKVTLDGQGADEQLAGYHYFFGFLFKGLLREIKLLKLISEIYHYTFTHRSINALKIFIFFLLPSIFRIRAKVTDLGYLNREFIHTYSEKGNLTFSLNRSNDLNEALLNDFEYKLTHLLKWEDRNSMWFSIESRVPFLDHHLVERTLSLPSSYVIDKGITKVILRQSMKGILPEKIRNRQDKIGFFTPLDDWVRQPIFKQYIFDLLDNKELFRGEIINQKKATTLYQSHLNGNKNIGQEIWKWIILDLWYKEFIDKKDG